MSSEIEQYESDPAKMARDRRLPPMSSMTRLQRRYLLEPWFTTGMVGAWVIALLAFCAACILPWHVELVCFGGVWVLAGTGFATAKFWHQDANSRTEGSVMPPPRRDDRY